MSLNHRLWCWFPLDSRVGCDINVQFGSVNVDGSRHHVSRVVGDSHVHDQQCVFTFEVLHGVY